MIDERNAFYVYAKKGGWPLMAQNPIFKGTKNIAAHLNGVTSQLREVYSLAS
jgi:hypothetical protein